MGYPEDITGERFGKLVAIEYMGAKKWKFKCDCGGEVVAYTDNVKRGKTRSCGCLYRSSRKERNFYHEDITGEKFNRLTAVKYVGDGRWECSCECGGTTKASKSALINGRTKSCGCLKKQTGEANKKWKGGDVTYNTFHKRVKNEKGAAKDFGCSVCGRKGDGVSYDWANLTGNYWDIDDYAPMCRFCHRQYDKKRRGICKKEVVISDEQ